MWRSSEGACVCVHWMWDTWSDSINKQSVQAPLILYSCVYIQYIQYVHAMGVILLLTCTWSVVPTVLIRSSTQSHLWPRVAVESEEFFQLVFQLVVPMFCCFAPQTLHSNSACKSCHEDGTYVQYFTGQSCEWDMKRTSNTQCMKRTSNTQHLMPTSNTQCMKRMSNTQHLMLTSNTQHMMLTSNTQCMKHHAMSWRWDVQYFTGQSCEWDMVICHPCHISKSTVHVSIYVQYKHLYNVCIYIISYYNRTYILWIYYWWIHECPHSTLLAAVSLIGSCHGCTTVVNFSADGDPRVETSWFIVFHLCCVNCSETFCVRLWRNNEPLQYHVQMHSHKSYVSNIYYMYIYIYIYMSMYTYVHIILQYYNITTVGFHIITVQLVSIYIHCLHANQQQLIKCATR